MIHNIWAVGRNYSEHAKELGNDLPTEPMIFLKAGSCLSEGNDVILSPHALGVHHEIEMVLQFGADLQIHAYGLALDLTDRDMQNRLKNQGHPWTLAKSFKNSCPVSRLIPLQSLNEINNFDLELYINGELRQKGNTSQLIFSPQVLMNFVQKHFPVKPYDLLLTGTPAGVGPLHKGDKLVAKLGSQLSHNWVVK